MLVWLDPSDNVFSTIIEILLLTTEQVSGTDGLPEPVAWTNKTGSHAMALATIQSMCRILYNWYPCDVQEYTDCMVLTSMV